MRIIDADDLCVKLAEHMYDDKSFFEILEDLTTIEAIPKADYDARLKADMVDMLYEIQAEIKKLYKKVTIDNYEVDVQRNETVSDCYHIIQEKINSLRGEEK